MCRIQRASNQVSCIVWCVLKHNHNYDKYFYNNNDDDDDDAILCG